MNTTYLVVQHLSVFICDHDAGKYYGDETKTIIEIFQDEELALQFLNSLKPLSETIKVDDREETRETDHYIQKVSKGTKLAIRDSHDPEWYLFP